MNKRCAKNKPLIFQKKKTAEASIDIDPLSSGLDFYLSKDILKSDIFCLPALILSVFLVSLITLSYYNPNLEHPDNNREVFAFDSALVKGALAEENTPAELAKIYRTNKLQEKISQITQNTPMASMTPAIAQQNQTVAAFLVGIALKESKFGTYAPKKDGRDCYNYWGYRGQENPTISGYSCFDTPEQAVEIVGKRLEKLVKQGRKTPTQMIIWKCGYSCAGHSEDSVKSWINDVSINFYKINQDLEIAKN